MSFRQKLDGWPRVQHAFDLGIGWWAVLIGLWSLLQNADFVVGKVCSTEMQQKWAALWLHPTWGWRTWALGVCVITTGWVIEQSFRILQRERGKHIEALADQSKELSETITTQKQAFDGMLLAKDRELRDAVAQAAEMCRGAISAIQKECDAFEKELSTYKLVWGVLQLRTGVLAKELRLYCEETVAPEPIPPPIDGESDADLLVRKAKLMQPWMDKITREYNGNFAERVGYLRDYFAAQGYEDFKLDDRINTAVVDTDQIREIADRLMGLALRELAKRQLRILTLKQLLCCD